MSNIILQGLSQQELDILIAIAQAPTSKLIENFVWIGRLSFYKKSSLKTIQTKSGRLPNNVVLNKDCHYFNVGDGIYNIILNRDQLYYLCQVFSCLDSCDQYFLTKLYTLPVDENLDEIWFGEFRSS